MSARSARLLPIAVALAWLAGCATTQSSSPTDPAAAAPRGTLGGTALGSQSASDSSSNVAGISDALAGGVLGEELGNALDQKDREALAAITYQVLETDEPAIWRSAHSKATAAITLAAIEELRHDTRVWRSPKVARASELTLINQLYRAVRPTVLRAAPDAKGQRLGGFGAGHTLVALGRTTDNWIAVGHHGIIVGYVAGQPVAPVQAGRKARSPHLERMTAASARSWGFDAEAILPLAAVSDSIVVRTSCRVVSYALSTPTVRETRKVQACHAPSGAWVLENDAARQSAPLPARPVPGYRGV